MFLLLFLLKYSLFCFICNHSYQLYRTLIHTHKDKTISYSSREEMESTCESQSKSVYTAEFMGTALKVHVQVSDHMSMNPGEAEHMFCCSRCTRKCLCLSAHFFGSLGSRTGKKGRGEKIGGNMLKGGLTWVRQWQDVKILRESRAKQNYNYVRVKALDSEDLPIKQITVR